MIQTDSGGICNAVINCGSIYKGKDMEKNKNDITYHNKDVLSKIMAENFKDKSLKVYGLDVPRIKQILPTNLPALQVNEMRIDNLFLLEDDSVAIIDYESSVKWENSLKYINYVARILERYKKDKKPKQIRMIVIYTADVEYTSDTFSAGALTLKMEQAFLSRIDSETVRDRIKEKIEKQIVLSEEELMELIVLPLTYKGREAKKTAVKEAVDLAKRIEVRDTQTFVLSGILVFADKIIDSETANYIKEVIRMTQVAELLIEEGRRTGIEEGRRSGIDALIDSLRSLSIPDDTIISQLAERYQLTRREAEAFLEQK